MPSGFSGLNDSSTIVQKLWNYCNVLRDESLNASETLPKPDVIAAEITENLEAALEQFASIYEALEAK